MVTSDTIAEFLRRNMHAQDHAHRPYTYFGSQLDLVASNGEHLGEVLVRDLVAALYEVGREEGRDLFPLVDFRP